MVFVFPGEARHVETGTVFRCFKHQGMGKRSDDSRLSPEAGRGERQVERKKERQRETEREREREKERERERKRGTERQRDIET